MVSSLGKSCSTQRLAEPRPKSTEATPSRTHAQHGNPLRESLGRLHDYGSFIPTTPEQNLCLRSISMEPDSHSHGRRRGERNEMGSNLSDGLLTPVEYQSYLSTLTRLLRRTCQHLLRHITRIQIRNFTPFPARDAFASALTQPSEQSQFTSYGSLSDDLDVALSRKRTRRMSSASTMTVKSRLDGHSNDESRAAGSASPPDLRVRKRTTSRVSARESPASAGPGSHPPLSGTGMASRANRPRTQSMSSSISGKAAPTSTQWQSHTQKTLEKVLRSRLVETFVTITIPSTSGEPESQAKPSTPVSASHTHRPSSRESPASNRNPRSLQGTPPRPTSGPREGQHTRRISRTATAVSTNKTASPSSARKVAASPSKLNGNASKLRPHISGVTVDNETRTVPNFISTIHNPSTNPDFPLDIHDFSKQTDLSATYITVQLWAKLHQGPTSVNNRDKGKEKMSDEVDFSDPQWRAARCWGVCLADLVPLPDEVGSLLIPPTPLPKEGCITADCCSAIKSTLKYTFANPCATRQDILLTGRSIFGAHPPSIALERL